MRALVLAALLILAACGDPARFHATDITGADFGRDFTLVDPAGKTRRLADFKGKAVAVFFGYTQCPDVCPTTLATMAEVMKQLGPSADKLQVLFVTLDPERDTREVLAAYVPRFHPNFLGLSGDAAATAAVAKEYKLFYQKQPVAGGYTVDHTAATYLYDPRGRLRLYVAYGAPAADIAEDLKLLIAGK